ncbi:hypothetical protein Peur_008148 [Populus x canadensis]
MTFICDRSPPLLNSGFQARGLMHGGGIIHGVTAVAGYELLLHQKVPVELTALIFTAEMAALEAEIGSVDSEKAVPKNEWPRVTIWTGEKMAAKEANRLPQLLLEGKATRFEINPPITISGTLGLYRVL